MGYLKKVTLPGTASGRHQPFRNISKIPPHWNDGVSHLKLGNCEWCGLYASLRPTLVNKRVIWLCGRCIANEEKRLKMPLKYAKRRY